MDIERIGHHPRPTAGSDGRRAYRASARFVAALALALLAPPSAPDIEGQGGGLFTAATAPRGGAAANVNGPGGTSFPDNITLRSRRVTIDLDMLARVASGPSAEPDATALTLNLFEDAVFTGIVEGRAPTFSGGYALLGRIEGVEPGSMTLVVNGAVVAGSVRTPTATYRIRAAGAATYTISQIDSSRLPEGAEPLTAESVPGESFGVESFKVGPLGGEPTEGGEPPLGLGRPGSRPAR